MTAEPAGAAQFGAVAAMAIDVGLQLVAGKKRCVEHNLHRTSGTLAIVERQIHFAFRYQPVVEIQFASLDDTAHISAFTRIEKVVFVILAPVFGVDVFSVVQFLVGGHKMCVFCFSIHTSCFLRASDVQRCKTSGQISSALILICVKLGKFYKDNEILQRTE